MSAPNGLATAAEPAAAIDPGLRRFVDGGSFVPIGDSGLARWAGVVVDEPVADLQGRRWHTVARRMLLSPVVRGMLFAVEMLIRRAEWTVEPATGDEVDDDAAQEAAGFVESCRADMRTPWEDTLAQILSFLPYGYSLFEVVYKRRLGDGGDQPSRADDGRIGWDEWAPRSQDTLERWVFDGAGHAVAFVQKSPSQAAPVLIPLARCLHFRAGGYRGSPEGESVLRAAFGDWDAINKIQTIESIGIERDLAGLPVFRIPAEMMDANATPAQKAAFEEYKRIGVNLRRGDQSVVILPSEVDGDTKAPRYSLELLSSGGQRQIDTGAVVSRRSSHMAMVMLADWLTLGHGKVGSYALAQPVTASVLTPTGFVPMGRLAVDDKVVDPFGAPSVVTAIHEHGLRQVYEVHFGDGRVVETSADHRWAVTTPYWQRQGVPRRPRLPWAESPPAPYPQLRRFGVLTSEQMRQRLEAPGATAKASFEVPDSVPTEFASEQSALPVDPYVMGVILGDGWTGQDGDASAVVVTTTDEEIIDAIRGAVGETVRIKRKPGEHRAVGVVLSTGYRTRGNVVTAAVRELGLRGKKAHDKFIPSAYLRASVSNRIALLQGLMDTDGTCLNGQNVFTTVSPSLADDVEYLARSLGATSVHRRTRPAATAQRRKVYVVDFDVAHGIVPFRLRRKVARYQRKRTTYGSRIVRVIPTDRYEDMRCISVSAPSSLYLTDGFVPTHNSQDKTKLFTTAISAWLDAIANVINDQAIRPLLRLNGIDPALTPRLRPGALDETDLAATGQFFTALLPLIQELNQEDKIGLMRHLFDVVDWPTPTTEPEDEEAVPAPTEPPVPTVDPNDPDGVTPAGGNEG